MWGKVSCLGKQHHGRDGASNHRPSDLKSKALTTIPPRPYNASFARWKIGESRNRGSKSARRFGPPDLTLIEAHDKPLFN